MDKVVSLSDFLGQLSLGLDAVERSLLGAEPYHGKRVAVLCIEMGRHLGYTPQRLFTLAGCALLHDNALTEYILSERTGTDSSIGFKTHCEMGERNCRLFPFPTPPDNLVRYHHERADGQGPFGMTEGEFPEEAGLIALADRTDVELRLRQGGARKVAQIQAFLRKGEGSRFTSTAVQAALEVVDEALLERLGDSRVEESLTAALPKVSQQLSEAELLRIAGITAKIIDYKSEFTRCHTTQIANKAWYMAQVYALDAQTRVKLYVAAALHDIGKLFIPTEILEKPGRLTSEEYEIIKSHVQYTWDLLSGVRGLEEIALWASSHHEKLDGSGYPFGTQGEDLDWCSRLLACLDIYQAVREARPYHAARSHEETMGVLNDMAGRGLLDQDLCADLGRYLGRLDGGEAPPPQEAEVWHQSLFQEKATPALT